MTATFATPRALRMAAALLAAAVATACAGSRPATLPSEAHKITVREVRDRLEIATPADKVALSLNDRDALTLLAETYRNEGHGDLIVALPANGGNEEAVAITAAQTRDVLEAGGVAYVDILGARYDAAGDAAAPIVVMFSRYVAEAPDCFRTWGDFARTSDGANTVNFGCASQANLAAMVADPRDLLGPRAMDPGDIGRRTVVLDKYRKGESTGAKKSEDQKTAISDAVN